VISDKASVTSEIPDRYLQVDEEGYFSTQGQRTSEQEFGKELLQSLVRHESGVFIVESMGTPALLEPFDQPLVVQFVEKL
jgi:hypothetical protein